MSIAKQLWCAALAMVVFAACPAPAQQPLTPLAERVFADFPPVDSKAAFLNYANAWPERWGVPPGPGVRCVVLPVKGNILKPEIVRTTGWPRPNGLAEQDPLANELFEALGRPEAVQNFKVRSLGSGATVVRTRPRLEGERVLRRNAYTATLTFRTVSARAIGEDVLELDETWFSLFEPDQAGEPRAVVLLMPGLLGTPEGILQALTARLNDAGYPVLRMICQPSRFVEQAVYTIDPADGLDEEARFIAASFDNRTAECAFAVQAAFDYLNKERPALAAAPRIAIGCSGGAMTLPTVVARDPEPYKAAVLIGGGAGFWLLNERSNYAEMIGAVDARWKPAADALGDAPKEADRRKLADLYLDHAALDAFHTAAALEGKRVLMVHGSLDRAVPAPLGDALWERLGRPERWSEEVGHEALFMNLPARFDDMVRWVDAAVGP